MSAKTKEERIIEWIGRREVGERFYARQISKDLNLTGSRGTGKILFRMDCLRNVGRCTGNTHVWEKVAA